MTTFQLKKSFPTLFGSFQLRLVLSHFAWFFPTSLGSFQLQRDFPTYNFPTSRSFQLPFPTTRIPSEHVSLIPTQKRSKKSNFKLQKLASGAFDNISHAFLPREKYFHLVCFGMSLMWRLNQAEIYKNTKKLQKFQKITKSLETWMEACVITRRWTLPAHFIWYHQPLALKNYNNRSKVSYYTWSTYGEILKVQRTRSKYANDLVKFGHFSGNVGCIFVMVTVHMLPHAEFGRNDHREDAPHFNNPIKGIKWQNMTKLSTYFERACRAYSKKKYRLSQDT